LGRDDPAIADPKEQELEMARRHVREGERRVARQTEMVAELEHYCRNPAAVLARELLAILRKTLNLAKQDLQAILGNPKR
jgi:hypothetical protein